MSSGQYVSFPKSRFPFLLLVGFPVLGGSAAMYHDMHARWDDLIVATRVDDNDHEFPVI